MNQLKQAAPAGINPRWWAWEQMGGTGRPGVYIIWIRERWGEFRRQQPDRLYGDAEHMAFDNWLFSLVQQTTK